jgi:hypothetical protein
MTRPPDWTPAEDDALLRLRDAEGKCWADVGASLPGRSDGAIKLRYYHALRDRNAVAEHARRRGRTRRRPIVEPVSPVVSLGRVEAPAPAPLPAAPFALPASPSARRVSTAILIADAELRARIALPGRSALDQRKGRGDG